MVVDANVLFDIMPQRVTMNTVVQIPLKNSVSVLVSDIYTDICDNISIIHFFKIITGEDVSVSYSVFVSMLHRQ